MRRMEKFATKSESFLSPGDIPSSHMTSTLPTQTFVPSIDNESISSLLSADGSPAMPSKASTSVLKSQDIVPLKLGPNLSRYGVNLNKLAEEGKLDEVVGRDKEILTAMQVLSRRRKNNPCLVGEAGVGKTSIAEGIAILIHRKAAPTSLLDKVMTEAFEILLFVHSPPC